MFGIKLPGADLFKKIGDIAGKVAKVAGKAFDIIQSPAKAITEPLKKIAGGFLDKLPFGIGKIAKPFVDKFLDSGVSMLLGGPLSGVMEMAKKAAPFVKGLGDLATTVKEGADKVGALTEPLAQQNMQNIFAQAQAQHVF